MPGIIGLLNAKKVLSLLKGDLKVFGAKKKGHGSGNAKRMVNHYAINFYIVQLLVILWSLIFSLVCVGLCSIMWIIFIKKKKNVDNMLAAWDRKSCSGNSLVAWTSAILFDIRDNRAFECKGSP
jgi:hypothetical protein